MADSPKEFDEAEFEQKLLRLKDTQESIQGMSAWCLQKRAYHKKIVTIWLNVLKQGKNWSPGHLRVGYQVVVICCWLVILI